MAAEAPVQTLREALPRLGESFDPSPGALAPAQPAVTAPAVASQPSVPVWGRWGRAAPRALLPRAVLGPAMLLPWQISFCLRAVPKFISCYSLVLPDLPQRVIFPACCPRAVFELSRCGGLAAPLGFTRCRCKSCEKISRQEIDGKCFPLPPGLHVAGLAPASATIPRVPPKYGHGVAAFSMEQWCPRAGGTGTGEVAFEGQNFGIFCWHQSADSHNIPSQVMAGSAPTRTGGVCVCALCPCPSSGHGGCDPLFPHDLNLGFRREYTINTHMCVPG